MIDEMNKHAKAIQELNLSTKESLTIAIETLGMVNRRAEVTLSQAVKKDDKCKHEVAPRQDPDGGPKQLGEPAHQGR